MIPHNIELPDTQESHLTSPRSDNQSFSVLNTIDNSVQDMRVIKLIHQSRFPIYMVQSREDNRRYAMKVFQYEGDTVSKYYLNEIRFASFKHANVISYVSTVDRQTTTENDKPVEVSYILMDLAHCDFSELVSSPDFNKDEKLIRTYFHQLIEGLEYLHSEGICHMDIKPENILLGGDLRLKITDLDLSYKKDDQQPYGAGSRHFRAPEIIDRTCKSPESADVFSAGVMLFMMRVGHLPFLENELVKGFDLFNMIFDDPVAFWSAQSRINRSARGLGLDFRELFLSMIRKNPLERATIDDIKKSKWYQGAIYELEELEPIVDSLLKNSVLNTKISVRKFTL